MEEENSASEYSDENEIYQDRTEDQFIDTEPYHLISVMRWKLSQHCQKDIRQVRDNCVKH